MKKAQEFAKSGKYKEAIELLEKAEKYPVVHPEIYVRKAIYTQLSDTDVKYELEDAENFLRKALSIDDEYINALIELGAFYFVESKSADAKKLLKKAIKILKSNLNDAILTLAKCIEEIEGPQNAIEYLINVKLEIIDKKKFNNLLKEFEDMK